ncbi:uncharacterized protein [Watersipora subatra]|uniref:uncharacterized protein isoform X2 n=1 Tax=Watersipora subatra TaxID=2589382 RepID=UPI00355C9C1E
MSDAAAGSAAASLKLKGNVKEPAAEGERDLISCVKERLKNDGLQTVSKLLHESRAENRILKEKNNQLERTVDTLSNRLLKSATGSVPTSNGDSHTVSNQDEEALLPASSKHLVENLIRENNRLKHQLHNPQKIDEINMKACNLQSLNTALKQEKRRLEQELADLKSAIDMSDNEKDQHIIRLLAQLRSTDQKFEGEKNHRMTLEAEICKLKDELTDTAQKCLNMRRQLPSTTNSSHGQGEERINSLPEALESLGKSGTVPELSEQSLYEQNSRLEARCNYLEQQVRSLQKSSLNSRTPEQLVTENSMLKEKLAEKDEKIRQLKEQCDVLKHQLDAYHEDFKEERTDRVRTTRKYTKMEEDFRNLAMQVPTALNTGTNAWDGRQQAAARPRSSQPAVRFSTQSSKPASKDTQRKPVSGRSNDKSSAKTAVAPNFEGDNDSLSSQTELVRPTLSGKQKTELACYKCDKRFGVDHHSELIDHLDTCTGPA